MSDQAQSTGVPKKSGFRVLAIIAIPLIIVLVVMAPTGRWRHRPLHLKTCLTVADDLRTGASVRISGVEVGSVRRVQVRPDDHACPIMVEMTLQNGYDLKIPRDSETYSAAEGLLGPAYVGIDSSNATGTPIEDWGTLPSKVVAGMDAKDLLKEIDGSLHRVDKSLQQSRPKTQGQQTTPISPK